MQPVPRTPLTLAPALRALPALRRKASRACLVSVHPAHKSTTIPRFKPVIVNEAAARAIP
jgi:hypothetical protein